MPIEKHSIEKKPIVKQSKQLKASQLNHWSHWLAVGFGSGLAPKAPGTFGTLAALPLCWFLMDLSLLPYLAVLLMGFVIGVWLCGKTAKHLGVHDHSGIVWDEFVGIWITMLLVPKTWLALLIGFVLFRFFDVIKPWPIRVLDKKVHGGFGIMIDDAIAGVFACLCLHGLLYFGFLL